MNVFVRSGETSEVMELSRSQYPKDCLNSGGGQFSGCSEDLTKEVATNQLLSSG